MENNIFNLKCPSCGNNFTLSTRESEVKCPSCGRTTQFDKASKYFKSFSKIEKEEKLVAEGESFLKVDSLIEEGNFYLKNEDFKNAEISFSKALELTNVDYRPYLGLVLTKTKNFTDLDDISHIEYLQKAISCGDYNSKKMIREMYGPYYKKKNMSKDDLQKQTKDELDLLYKKVESNLKYGIPSHFKKEKMNKVFKWLIPIIYVLSIPLLILAFTLSNDVLNQVFSYVGILFFMTATILLITLFSNINKVNYYNFILDLFDIAPKFQLDVENNTELFKLLEKTSLSYINGDSQIVLDDQTKKIINHLMSLKDDKIDDFIRKYKFIGKLYR